MGVLSCAVLLQRLGHGYGFNSIPEPHHVIYLLRLRFFRNLENLDYLNFDNECRKNEGYVSVAVGNFIENLPEISFAYRKFHSPSARTCGKTARVKNVVVELRCAK